MSGFVDVTLLRFLQDPFVTDFLTNGVGLTPLFNATYNAIDIELKDVALGSVAARSFEHAAFESVRMRGTYEQIIPTTQRTTYERTQPRNGRLEWVDVFLNVTLATKTHDVAGPLDTLTLTSLEAKLGAFATVIELRTKLAALYAPSVVDAMFTALRITTIEDFKRSYHLFLEMVGKAPPAYDPNDPANARTFPVQVCVKIHEAFDLSNALQSAKLCRTILENESSTGALSGVDTKTPYAFVTVFPDASVTNTTVPGTTAAQTKTNVKSVFAAENMFAYFAA